MYRIPSKFLSLAFAIFMLCHAAPSSAYVGDSNVRTPSNYYGFWPPAVWPGVSHCRAEASGRVA